MKTAALIFAFISEAWGLLFKLAIVILVIAGIWIFISNYFANATLNEHSSCKQFEQADTSTQNKVLQDMMTAHHDQGSVSTALFSLTLYCDTHDQNSPIDGIYSGGNVGQQPAQALHISTPLKALVYSRYSFFSPTVL
jgi:hypothetical protein